MTEARPRFRWRDEWVEFEPSDSIAAALERAGIHDFGQREGGGARYFCGIGACQACVLLVDETRCEACLTPARVGQQVGPVDRSQP